MLNLTTCRYGGCFGCQIIAHALQGKVDYNPNQKFILKIETIHLQNQCVSLSNYFTTSKQYLNLIESHGDCVCVLPEGATLLAYSDSCNNEIFVCGAHNNILACQSHPEFDLERPILNKIWPHAVKGNFLTENEIIEYEATFKIPYQADALEMINFIKSFLSGSISIP